MVPFKQTAIDTIGPWIHEMNGLEMKTNAHTMIDTCSNPLKLKQASQANPTGRKSVQVLKDTWLLRHPKPVRIIHDQGSECCNIDFESFLISQGIKGVPCAAKNQQSNAIPEQVHDAIKTLL